MRRNHPAERRSQIDVSYRTWTLTQCADVRVCRTRADVARTVIDILETSHRCVMAPVGDDTSAAIADLGGQAQGREKAVPLDRSGWHLQAWCPGVPGLACRPFLTSCVDISNLWFSVV